MKKPLGLRLVSCPTGNLVDPDKISAIFFVEDKSIFGYAYPSVVAQVEGASVCVLSSYHVRNIRQSLSTSEIASGVLQFLSESPVLPKWWEHIHVDRDSMRPSSGEEDGK